MITISKKLNKRHYVFVAFVLLVSLGKLFPNITVNFFATAIWETFLVPLAVIVFWDNFYNYFYVSDREKANKFFKMFIIILIYTVFYNFIAFYYLFDMPNAIRKNYITTEGKVTYESVKKGIRDVQYFEINERIYYNYTDDFISVKEQEIYRVKTLKNSKFVFGIEKTN